MAPRHIGQGSQLVYISQPCRVKEPSWRQAARMATTSAWAVGSLPDVTWLCPSAMTWPLRAMTAPNGPPRPARIFSADRAMARRMSCSGVCKRSVPHVECCQRRLVLRLLALRDDQELGGPVRADCRRFLAADAGNADGAGQSAQQVRRNADGAQTAGKARPLGLAADQTEEGEVAAPEDLRTDLQIQRVAMSHDEIERTRRSARHFARRRGGHDLVDPRRHVRREGVATAVDPGDAKRQWREGTDDRLADMAGAEQEHVVVALGGRVDDMESGGGGGD